MLKRLLALGAILCAFAAPARADFVLNLTSLTTTKQDLFPLPSGANANNYIVAADYNAVTQAALDLRSAITGSTIGFALTLGDGSAAAVGASGTGALRYNNSTHIFEASLNGGAWASFGGGSTGNWTFSGGGADLSSGTSMFVGTPAGTTGTATTLVLGQQNGATVWLGSNAGSGTTNVRSFDNWFQDATAASAGTTLVNSPQFNLRPHYWNGAADTTYAFQMLGVMDSTGPTAHLALKWNGTEMFQMTSGKAFNIGVNGSVGTISQAATNTTSITIAPNVADGASSVGLSIDAQTSQANATASFLRIRNVSTALLNVRPNSSDGVKLVDGGGSSALTLSTNAGTTLCYSSACYSAGSGSVTIADGTGQIAMSAGALTLTITQGVADADGTRDWGLVGTRWRTLAGKRIITGEQNLSFSATPAFDCTAGNHVHIGTITANVTAATMVSGSAGEECTVTFLKDGTASAFTLVFSGTNVRTAGTATMTTGAGSLASITFWWDANLATPAWVEKARTIFN